MVIFRSDIIREQAAENSCLQAKLDRALSELQEIKHHMYEQVENGEAKRLEIEGEHQHIGLERPTGSN